VIICQNLGLCDGHTGCKYCAEIERLTEALQAAYDHLEYCGYGDAWERECALSGKDPLDKKIEAALASAMQRDRK
jgi:hypothetical protein